MSWSLVYARQAPEVAKKVTASGLKGKAQELLEILEQDPFQGRLTYEPKFGSWRT